MTSSKSNSTTNQARIFAVLLLTGIISVANEFALLKSAIATPVVVSTSQNYKLDNAGNVVVSQGQNNSQTTIQVQRQNDIRSGLPLTVVNAVIKDVSRRENIPQTRLRIFGYSKETWRNGCLEVLKPGEMCTQALVPGYRVTVSDGSQKWIYHTDNNGRNLRLASGGNSGDSNLQLPESVKSRVLTDASQRLGQPVSNFFIMQVQQKTWKDGCLELRDANTICSQVLVPGWRVIVGTKGQSLVYHTNNSGSVIKLNEKASEITDNGLPSQVKDSVIKAASELTGSSRIRVTKAEQVTFTDSCLNLGGPAESCLRANQRGWKVTVRGARQTLVYHTSIDGNQIRLNANASKLRLPRNVRNGVLKEARNISGLSGRRLRIVSFKPANWGYGCEDFSLNNPCDRTNVSGWQVTVSGNSQNWVFFTDATGNQVKLSNQSNQNSQPTSGLPQAVKNAVLRDASQWSGLPQRRIRIAKSERKVWSNPCYLTFNRICNKAFIRTPGWIVTVEANKQRWVYHANDNASIVALDRTPSLTQKAAAVLKQDAARRSRYTSSVSQIRVIEVKRLNERQDNVPLMKAVLSDTRKNWIYRFKQDGSEFKLDAAVTLPKSIENAVLSDVRNRVKGRDVSPRNIVETEQVRWRNGCLGIVNERKRRYCFYRLVDGYRVTVRVGSELFVYHTDSRSRVILNETASKINGNQATVLPVRIPRNELPSPLNRGVLFRQISSGGFAGQTYETVLLEDGRVMRYRMGDINDSQRSLRRVSPQQVRDFQRLLQRQSDEFRNMSYPASRGAADFITYTLTSRDGTIQFNDSSRNNLPQDLLNVVEAWNRILRS